MSAKYLSDFTLIIQRLSPLMPFSLRQLHLEVVSFQLRQHPMLDVLIS